MQRNRLKIFIILFLIAVIMITAAWFIRANAASDDELILLAKTVFGEAGGCSRYEQSLVVWCILNRVDKGTWGDTITDVILYPSQFHGYLSNNPVDEDILELCKDVVNRWENGLEGRTLPKEYLYFYGDGKHNYFQKEYQGTDLYDWSLENIYEEDSECLVTKPQKKCLNNSKQQSEQLQRLHISIIAQCSEKGWMKKILSSLPCLFKNRSLKAVLEAG